MKNGPLGKPLSIPVEKPGQNWPKPHPVEGWGFFLSKTRPADFSVKHTGQKP